MAETDSRILEYLEEGLFLYGVGKVQESIVRWRKVLELDPRNERAMDYIESAGGDVSQFRAKAGLPPKSGAPAPGGTAPVPPPDAPPPPPPPAAAPPPVAPAMPVPPSTTAATMPLDPAVLFDGSFGTGTEPPAAPGPELAPRRPTPGGMGSVMPWQSAPAAAPPQTATTTVPSASPMPAGGPVGAQSVSATATVTSPSPPIGSAPAAPPAAADPRQELINQAGALYQARHFEQSLELLERIAREYPPVDDALRGYMDAARNGLYEILKAQWPRPDLVPEIRMNGSQVMQLKLSPEAGFIFSRVDGVSTVEEILAMGGLDPFTTLRALSQLVRAGVIGVQG